MSEEWLKKDMTLDKYCWLLAFHHLKPWKHQTSSCKGCSFTDCESIPWNIIEIKTRSLSLQVKEEHMKRYNGLV